MTKMQTASAIPPASATQMECAFRVSAYCVVHPPFLSSARITHFECHVRLLYPTLERLRCRQLMFELHFNVLLVLRPLLQTSYKASPATPTWRVNHWIVTTLASAPQKGCARMATAQMEWTVRDVMVCILYARVWCKNKDFLPTMNSAAESVVFIFPFLQLAMAKIPMIGANCSAATASAAARWWAP
jgi:hypothetical protein